MIGISNTAKWSEAEWRTVLAILPGVLHPEINRYRRWSDRQAGALGKLLLAHLLKWNVPELGKICRDRYQRPYLPDDPTLDFNISHTEGYVVCALSRSGRIGIDVEACHPTVDLTDFHRVYTAREITWIESADDPQLAFYHLWTRKEAVMKADGRGFYLNPATFEGLSTSVWVESQLYHTKVIDLGTSFCCHLAQVATESVTYRFFPGLKALLQEL